MDKSLDLATLCFQMAGVYLSLNGSIVPNHGYVVISDIGTANDDTALFCHTNHPADSGPMIIFILEETGLHQMGLQFYPVVQLFQDSGGIELTN